jgi:hypothetical protein
VNKMQGKDPFIGALRGGKALLHGGVARGMTRGFATACTHVCSAAEVNAGNGNDPNLTRSYAALFVRACPSRAGGKSVAQRRPRGSKRAPSGERRQGYTHVRGLGGA